MSFINAVFTEEEILGFSVNKEIKLQKFYSRNSSFPDEFKVETTCDGFLKMFIFLLYNVPETDIINIFSLTNFGITIKPYTHLTKDIFLFLLRTDFLNYDTELKLFSLKYALFNNNFYILKYLEFKYPNFKIVPVDFICKYIIVSERFDIFEYYFRNEDIKKQFVNFWDPLFRAVLRSKDIRFFKLIDIPLGTDHNDFFSFRNCILNKPVIIETICQSGTIEMWDYCLKKFNNDLSRINIKRLIMCSMINSENRIFEYFLKMVSDDPTEYYFKRFYECVRLGYIDLANNVYNIYTIQSNSYFLKNHMFCFYFLESYQFLSLEMFTTNFRNFILSYNLPRDLERLNQAKCLYKKKVELIKKLPLSNQVIECVTKIYY